MKEAELIEELIGELELMKFRQFKRYYFEFDYDWDKLEFLEKKYNDVRYFLNMDLDEFEAFLKQQSQDKAGLF